MITIKLPYKSTEKFQSKLLDLRKQYSNIVRYSYNRFIDGLTQKEIRLNSQTLNHIESCNSWIIQCGIMEANQLYKRFGTKNETKNIIFGGKLNFINRLKNKITKEEFQLKRLLPLNIQGEQYQRGNRMFKLHIIDENFIEFKLNQKEHFFLYLPNLKNNIKKQLFKLQQLNEVKQKKNRLYLFNKINGKLYLHFI